MAEPVSVFIGMGSNQGDCLAILQQALQVMGALPNTQLIKVSQWYQTPAWGKQDQPDFVNGVAQLSTTLAAETLLTELLAIEQQFGRKRDAQQHWEPRTLDLDILLYGQQMIDLPTLKVPHPYLHERAFALLPLLDIDAEIEIPMRGKAKQALAGLDATQINPMGHNALI